MYRKMDSNVVCCVIDQKIVIVPSYLMYLLHNLSVGGVDDAGQLRPGLQSPDRLDPASGEVGENRRPEQVIFTFFPSLLCFFLFTPFASVAPLN